MMYVLKKMRNDGHNCSRDHQLAFATHIIVGAEKAPARLFLPAITYSRH